MGRDKPNLPRCVSPIHTERCVLPCDRGRSRAQILQDLPEVAVWDGFDSLSDVWWPTGRSFRDEINPMDRVESFKRMLLERRESKICVVGHAGFFQCFTGLHLKNCDVLWIELKKSD